MVKTLNELAQLRDSGFGKPWPRHGLNLLYWFASEFVSFDDDNVMVYECNPAGGDFGFHLFEKRNDDNGKKLLPDKYHPYYVVGNLNIKKYSKAKGLPEHVSKNKSSDQLSNTDRIIVSLYDKDDLKRVYVTQHHDRSNYDPNATYRISRGLLMIIRRMSLHEFLEEINNRPQTTNPVSSNINTPTSSDPDDSDLDDSETRRLMTSPQRRRISTKKKNHISSSENRRTTRGECCTIL